MFEVPLWQSTQNYWVLARYVDGLYAVVERPELLGQLLAHPEEHSACPYQEGEAGPVVADKGLGATLLWGLRATGWYAQGWRLPK